MNDRHDHEAATALYAKAQANDLTESPEKLSPRLNTLTEKQQGKVIVRLWEQMRGIFGQSWVREHGELNGNQVTVWGDALGRLTLDQIKNGIEQSAQWQERFPPNLAQFSRMCLTTIKPTYTDRRIEGAKKEMELGQLAKPKREDSELVKYHKAIMREYMETGGGALIEPTAEESRRTIAYYNAKQHGQKAGLLHS